MTISDKDASWSALFRAVIARWILHFISAAAIAVLLPLHAAPETAQTCSDLHAAPDTRWRTENRQGVQWLVTPCGERFFSIGVNVLDGGGEARELNGRPHYNWKRFSQNLQSWAN